MKKKILFTLLLTLVFCFALTAAISAATYYVDSNGNLVDSTSDDIAYEYDRSNSNIANIYLHDSTITKIVIPDMSDFTGTIQLQSGFDASLGVYMVEDKETKATSLITKIKEIVVHENIYLDGAYSVGAFAGFTSLESLSFYGTVGCASKGGFVQNCNSLKEVHFYGKDLSIPSKLISDMGKNYTTDTGIMFVFHKGSTGTISTGYDTLPTVANLKDGFTLIINPDIIPKNPDDPRLGVTWGQVTATTGWELVVAISDKSQYTTEELEAFKTSHGFASRAASVDTATTKEAVVKTYCELGYDTHNSTITVVDGENGLLGEATKVTGCNKCLTGEEEKLSPVFNSLGYSVFADGSIMQSFSVNKTALSAYESASQSNVKFGLLAGVKDNLTGTNLINSDGTANQKLGATIASIDFTNRAYDIFEIKITGIKESYQEKNIYCCAYYVVNEKVYYMSNKIANQDISDMSTTFKAQLASSGL
ncbi:MAG: hypothetical protein IJW54_05865 [Clostridia bacterium]|nr:hypothetical protein [Clostridia bacterium]